MIGKTFYHTSIYMVSLMLNRGVAFLLIPVYTRKLDVAEFALWDLCTTSILFALPVVEVGMANAFMRFYHNSDKKVDKILIFNSSMLFILLISIPFLLLSYIFKTTISVLLFDSNSNLVILCSISVVVSVITAQFMALLRVQEKSIQFAVISLFRAILGPLWIIYFVIFLDHGVFGILLGELIGSVAACVVCSVLSSSWIRLAYCSKQITSMLLYGLPFIPWTFSTTYILFSDRYFLKYSIDINEVAIYGLGFKIAIILTLFTRAFESAWPASAFQIAKTKSAAQVFSDIHKLMFLILTVVAVNMSLFAHEIISIFGPHDIYYASAFLLPIITYVFVIYWSMTYILVGLSIMKKTYLTIIIVMVGVLVKTVSANYLITKLGVSGAGLSTLITLYVQYIISYRVVKLIYFVKYDLIKQNCLIFILLLSTYYIIYKYDTVIISSFLLKVTLCILLHIGIYFRYRKKLYPIFQSFFLEKLFSKIKLSSV